MSPEISERSFEEAIECGLLQYGPDACAGVDPTVREAPPPYGETPPGGYRKRRPEDYRPRAVPAAARRGGLRPRHAAQRSGRSSLSTTARRSVSSS